MFFSQILTESLRSLCSTECFSHSSWCSLTKCNLTINEILQNQQHMTDKGSNTLDIKCNLPMNERAILQAGNFLLAEAGNFYFVELLVNLLQEFNPAVLFSGWMSFSCLINWTLPCLLIHMISSNGCHITG